MSDPSRTIVTPLDVVERANSDSGLAAIEKLVRDHDVRTVVVGVPGVSVDGSAAETKQAARCRSFAARLRSVLDVPVVIHDERYTSRLADATIISTGTQASRDSVAACHILSSWLNGH